MRLGSNEKFLVTGGAGYVGAHTVHCLIAHGVSPQNIIVFDNLVHGHKEFLPDGVVFYQGDLLCKEDIRRVFLSHPIDAVFHFAAYAFVGESMACPGKYFENNLLGGIHLLEAMVQSGCRRIVFSSSCAVYGVPGDVAISEEIHPAPVSPYGESKLMFERILAWYHRIHKVSSISLRYFNAAGAGYGIGERHTPETHLIPLLMQAALGQREAFSIHGTDYNTRDGTCVRDFIHVGDLAAAHLNACAYLSDKQVCEIINLGSGEGQSVLQVIHLIQALTGSRIAARMAERRPGDAPVLIAGNQKAAHMIGWKPRRSLGDILESAWIWHTQEAGCHA
ncbi:MAG: UDP-glucose 4-epimerase GalE [Desulfobacteraceae bacterium]|nr:MAG: UDP-glucose 4-epimerase GalE [Desulfobacteraceae bacterium]